MEMLNSMDVKKVEQFLKMMKIFHDNISLIILVWTASLRALQYGRCTLKWIRGHLLCIVGVLHPVCSFSLLPVTEGFTFWTEICLIIFYVILWLCYTKNNHYIAVGFSSENCYWPNAHLHSRKIIDTKQHICYSNLSPRVFNSTQLLIISKVLSSAVMPHHWPSSIGKNSTAGVQHLSTLMSSNSLCSRISGFDPSVIIASALYFWIYCSFWDIFDASCTELKTCSHFKRCA